MKDGFLIAFSFLAIASLYGFIGVIYTIIWDTQTLLDMTTLDLSTIIMTGMCLGMAIVLANIASKMGSAGISNAVINS